MNELDRVKLQLAKTTVLLQEYLDGEPPDEVDVRHRIEANLKTVPYCKTCGGTGLVQDEKAREAGRIFYKGCPDCGGWGFRGASE